ncbi:hypothetical protein SELMODRAFT_421774 [Selaginella moellendorffii]|uniref:Uncharacterized protein n=2 Tax=Selaginella moellendorffii TaxID=88036 RepID=D8SGB4_SELML|nr:hypothetical protein SELMODRAFT_421774 [Selaginella moellendorffii]
MELLSITVDEAVYDERFRQYREGHFASVGIPDTLLTKTVVIPGDCSDKTVQELINKKGFILYEPIASTQQKDLLYRQATNYQEILKSDPQVGISNYKSLFDEMKTRLDKWEKESERQKMQISTLEREVSTSQQEVSTLQQEVSTLHKQVEAQQQEISTLHKQVEAQQQKIDWLEAVVARLEGLDFILARKLLDSCREKARSTLQQAGLALPADWNELMNMPAHVAALEAAGLPLAGLQVTCYGTGSIQSQGDAQAHVQSETPEQYSDMLYTCFTGSRLEGMLHVYKFRFGHDAVPGPELSREKPEKACKFLAIS